MLPLGAAISAAKKQVTGSRFDHAAVIINDRFGIPHVAEVTYSGVKLRRYDERILRSWCSEILLVPVSVECDEEARILVERHVKGMTLRPIKNILLLEFVGVIKLLVGSTKKDENEARKQDEAGLENFWSFIDSITVNPPVQLVMSCLDRVGAVDYEAVTRWKSPQLLTPKDFEDGVVPLFGGARFGEALPVRIHD